MKNDVIAARMRQIDDQLARIGKKKEEFHEFLDQLPKDDPSRPEHEATFKHNGMGEIAEFLNEKAKLAYIADHNAIASLKTEDLKPLIIRDIREEAHAIIKDFEANYGKATAASCAMDRCVKCVMCPTTCAGACRNCVHCPPNGVIHK